MQFRSSFSIPGRYFRKREKERWFRTSEKDKTLRDGLQLRLITPARSWEGEKSRNNFFCNASNLNKRRWHLLWSWWERVQPNTRPPLGREKERNSRNISIPVKFPRVSSYLSPSLSLFPASCENVGAAWEEQKTEYNEYSPAALHGREKKEKKGRPRWI